MNERIRQLMEQAGLYDFVIESMGIDEEMEKFAELIVRECSNIVFEAGCTELNQNCPNEELYQLSNKIEQHFGFGVEL